MQQVNHNVTINIHIQVTVNQEEQYKSSCQSPSMTSLYRPATIHPINAHNFNTNFTSISQQIPYKSCKTQHTKMHVNMQ